MSQIRANDDEKVLLGQQEEQGQQGDDDDFLVPKTFFCILNSYVCVVSKVAIIVYQP